MKKSQDGATGPEILIKTFAHLFRTSQDADAAGLDSVTRDLCDQMARVVAIIRHKPGANVGELMLQTQMSSAQIRRVLRLIITPRGEIELNCQGWKTATDGRFFLHNEGQVARVT